MNDRNAPLKKDKIEITMNMEQGMHKLEMEC